MNKNIKQLFFLVRDNRVILADSNLKRFVESLPRELAGIRTLNYYVRWFSKSNFFVFEFNRDYVFQKMEFNAEPARNEGNDGAGSQS